MVRVATLADVELNVTVRSSVCQSVALAVPVNDRMPVVPLYDAPTPPGSAPVYASTSPLAKLPVMLTTK